MFALVRETVRSGRQRPCPDRRPAIRRVDDQRGLPCRQDGVARVEPVAPVEAQLATGRSSLRGRGVLRGPGHDPLPMGRRHFLFSQVGSSLCGIGTFRRRDGLVPPQALEVRLAVCRARRRPGGVDDPFDLGRGRRGTDQRAGEGGDDERCDACRHGITPSSLPCFGPGSTSSPAPRRRRRPASQDSGRSRECVGCRNCPRDTRTRTSAPPSSPSESPHSTGSSSTSDRRP